MALIYIVCTKDGGKITNSALDKSKLLNVPLKTHRRIVICTELINIQERGSLIMLRTK